MRACLHQSATDVALGLRRARNCTGASSGRHRSGAACAGLRTAPAVQQLSAESRRLRFARARFPKSAAASRLSRLRRVVTFLRRVKHARLAERAARTQLGVGQAA